MSMEATIDGIVEKGKLVNKNLTKKIEVLEQHNNNFRETLINKLTIISNTINDFEKTKLPGLKQTKIDLDAARQQLQNTEAELIQTKAELVDVRNNFDDINNRLKTATVDKDKLDGEIANLVNKVREMELDCSRRIDVARKEMADKNTEGFKEMEQIQKKIQQDSDAKIGELNKNIEELRRQSEDAQRGQATANNELKALQENQQRLLIKLETVNDVLNSQLEMIDKNIDLNNPNYGDYEGLLDTIQAGLGGVISGINSAVSETTSSSSSGPPSSGPPESYSDTDVEQNYNKLLTLKESFNDITSLKLYLSKYMKCKKITQTQKDTLSDRLSQVFTSSYKEEAIKSYLKDYKVFIPDPNISGGKRKCKTMKKRPRKSRNLGTRNLGTRNLGTRHKHMKKYQKGGYTYNKNDKLNNASSDVSNLSISSSNTNIETNRKSKKGYKRPRSRTKRRSRK